MAAEMLIPIEERGPSISEDDVLRFEQKLGHRLPEDYREFLLVFNGGQTSEDKCIFPIGSDTTMLNSFWSLNDPEADIERTRERLRSQIPSSLLVIGYDCGGSSLCLVIDGEKRGEIWFYDTLDPHEPKLGLPWYERKRDFIRVASTFTEFLEMLEPRGQY